MVIVLVPPPHGRQSPNLDAGGRVVPQRGNGDAMGGDPGFGSGKPNSDAACVYSSTSSNRLHSKGAIGLRYKRTTSVRRSRSGACLRGRRRTCDRSGAPACGLRPCRPSTAQQRPRSSTIDPPWASRRWFLGPCESRSELPTTCGAARPRPTARVPVCHSGCGMRTSRPSARITKIAPDGYMTRTLRTGHSPA